jgi:hypothetical protein
MDHTTRGGAARINKRYDEIWKRYHELEEARKDVLPTCTDYSFFLDEAVKRLKITKDEARDQYGKFTYGQWKELLKLA